MAVIGYGSQGRAIALNLADSRYQVVVGLRPNSKSRTAARRDGITDLSTIAEAVRGADIVCMAIPDHRHAEVFDKHVAENLRKGTALLFLHGLSVHFGLVTPPKHCDVVMIAPHAPGVAVRDAYMGERNISAFYAVQQNFTRQAGPLVLKLAEAIGIKKSRLVKTTFRDEAIGDMFGEQAVLCGGLAMLIKQGFETLVNNGIKPDHAYLEVAYQLDLIISLIKKHGIAGMFSRISATARAGSLASGPRIVDDSTRQRMQAVYDDIASGRFTRTISRLSDEELSKIQSRLAALTDPRLERAVRKFSR